MIEHDLSTDSDTERAELYTKLSQACHLANILLQNKCGLWSSGGDGLVFGVHCADLPPNDSDESNHWQDYLHDVAEGTKSKDEAIPHLRAEYRYGNDINDAWRAISYMFELSELLFSQGVLCAIKCLDQDGELLLIEAAEVLPEWVDDEVSQGGVGGPRGCVNRCWIVDGRVRLIPPKIDTAYISKHINDVQLVKRDALQLLRKCIGCNNFIVDDVQNAIKARIERTDYTIRKRKKCKILVVDKDKNREEYNGSISIPHFHTTAAALPARLAYFFKNHQYLIPFCVDSFCTCAPGYLDQEREESMVESAASDRRYSDSVRFKSQKSVQNEESTHNISQKPKQNLGHYYSYEQIVILPITMTRTTYAELITGRGVIPSFPTPKKYRSVELNRFQRQLHQMSGQSNVWKRAVEVGVRLCAGLEWTLNYANKSPVEEELLLQTISETERRVRIHWCRIDAEARTKTSFLIGNKSDGNKTSWIDDVWKTGPNNSDKILSNAVQSMSKCLVFNPELSRPPHEVPCPYSRYGISLSDIVQSGLQQSLKWVNKEFTDISFPFPKECDIDDDVWMEVNSLEELENEMKKLSSTKDQTQISKNPRRITRRSRRNLSHNSDYDDTKCDQSQDMESLNNIIHGFKTLFEGESEVGGVVTRNTATSPRQNVDTPQQAMLQEVTIDPRQCLHILQTKLIDKTNKEGHENMIHEDNDISNFFFEEDLKDSESDDDTDKNPDFDCNTDIEASLESNSSSLKDIMVSFSEHFLNRVVNIIIN